jgi:hypothetical protein
MRETLESADECTTSNMNIARGMDEELIAERGISGDRMHYEKQKNRKERGGRLKSEPFY